MDNESIVFTLFLIFFGAAVIATIALTLRQSLIIAYIAVGILIGPSGFSLIHDAELIQNIANVGIIFLLFLLGLNLNPKELIQLAGETTLVTGISSLALLFLGYFYSLLFGYTQQEALIIGAALMFSSTIIGLKLIPTTILHHQHTGEIMISVLLMQDIIAIILLLALEGSAQQTFGWMSVGLPLLALPGLVLTTYLIEKYLLIRLIRSFDRIQEYIFLLAIGWCLGVAEAAEWLGLSYEIGAFIAGVSIARSPIALFIADSLKPLRDFFLIIFFVALGANFDLSILHQIWVASLGLILLAVLAKPYFYRLLLRVSKESSGRSTEVAMRLGQMSEFSLLLAVLAAEMDLIRDQVSFLIQFATLISFIISSTYVVMKYPTPIALSDRLRRD
ncbi:MAG: cation:proton antiporter [Gammaproteobacteria bacterium]|jgi:Kef-type K+ transport system membrane component KefB|nr:cation:proton antiporter [Gammaproteobacteria bacterium]MBT3722434.1 cation:proton antiporter [Gammaproteobacteria bacterium]MBT4078303.1 cation:proton antiporter [Gammaproteobacteria bacterium]MBT4196553.1 cation:proton antiporter [Gammaproteobacteria bacterium]MBT4450239.1 cation:proton antiporter [Gammaproteobacteria bacterium]